jgi:surfeit locus 1 family protein
MGPVVAAGVLLLAAAMASLGVWQLNRLQERRAENAVIRERLAQPPLDLNANPGLQPPEYSPAQATGTYDFAAEIILRNRTHLDAPGFHVLTPLRLAGRDEAVLVNRGWIPYTEAEPALRAAFQAPAGPVTVAGIARASQPRSRPFLPADPTLSPEMPRLDAWFWVDLDQIQQQLPYPLLPFYLEAAPAPEGATQLPISGYTVDLSEGAHFTYAIQWFAFTAILLIGSAALWRQARNLPSRPPSPTPQRFGD